MRSNKSQLSDQTRWGITVRKTKFENIRTICANRTSFEDPQHNNKRLSLCLVTETAVLVAREIETSAKSHQLNSRVKFSGILAVMTCKGEVSLNKQKYDLKQSGLALVN